MRRFFGVRIADSVALCVATGSASAVESVEQAEEVSDFVSSGSTEVVGETVGRVSADG